MQKEVLFILRWACNTKSNIQPGVFLGKMKDQKSMSFFFVYCQFMNF